MHDVVGVISRHAWAGRRVRRRVRPRVSIGLLLWRWVDALDG